MLDPIEEWRLETARIGRRVVRFEELASTNSWAASLADDPEHDGLVVLADHQTAGRGQPGRTWISGSRQSVLLSVLLLAGGSPSAGVDWRRPVILAAWAAVAVCEMLRPLGLSPRIKWPNDILVQDKKVAGILVERGRAIVVGIGLNVNQSPDDFERAGLPHAASLACFLHRSKTCQAPLRERPGGCFAPRCPTPFRTVPFLDRPLDPLELARTLIRKLDEVHALIVSGQDENVCGSWRDYLGLVGSTVQVETTSGHVAGRLRGLDWDRFVLETPEGDIVRLVPEQVRHFR